MMNYILEIILLSIRMSQANMKKWNWSYGKNMNITGMDIQMQKRILFKNTQKKQS